MQPDGARQALERFRTDPEFRRAMRANPEQAMRDAGYEMTDSQRRALARVKWNEKSDEGLIADADRAVGAGLAEW